MSLKKVAKALLYPHIAVMIALVPVSAVLLVYILTQTTQNSVFAYLVYCMATYTLTIWCLRIPSLCAFLRRFKRENALYKRWSQDARLRVNVSLFVSLVGNVLYVALECWLGIKNKSYWFFSLAGYYAFLSAMRFVLFRRSSTCNPGEKMREELVVYRACGWVFLVINVFISLIGFFMVHFGRTFVYDDITTIAMATYTFASFTLAIVNVVRYKKYDSPVYSASKAIGLAAASVSMFTLTATMLTVFGGEATDNALRKPMLAAVGGAVAVFISVMAVLMIVRSTARLNSLKNESDISDIGKKISSPSDINQRN